MELKDLVGKKIINAYWVEDMEVRKYHSNADSIVLEFENERYALVPEGDCCASSYIQHIDFADVLNNATIKEIEALEYKKDIENGRDDYNVIDQFGHRIHTDKGICTIDMRCSHNGYYYGFLTVRKAEDFIGTPLKDF
jgi:hypothetical protein